MDRDYARNRVHEGDVIEGAELLRFARSISTSPSLDELKQRFLAGFGRVVPVPMYGYALVDPVTESPTCVANGNVSATFVARYERHAKHMDPLLKNAYRTGETTYNLALMSAEEWEESEVYRRAYCVHSMRHVVEIPVRIAGRVAGNVHFATTKQEWDIGSKDIRVAEALSSVVGMTIEAIGDRDQMERERDQALAALNIAGTPYVVSDPQLTELCFNDPTRRLLADVVDADEVLHRLLARPAPHGGGTRRLQVQLVTGELGIMHARLSAPADDDDPLVAVLELERESAVISLEALAGLTPREAEVAMLVVDGLADREIAEQLFLSHHTVSQYVKRIYRKLDVDSRVGLTRELLRRPQVRG
jgi:DNA-binding CsgD family transcriptional regulator